MDNNSIYTATSIIILLALSSSVFVWARFHKYRKGTVRQMSNLSGLIEKLREENKKKEFILIEYMERSIKSQEQLEEMVIERGKMLERRNHQLMEYAYRNAHELRAPVARLLGLSNLIMLTNRHTEILKIAKDMNWESKELDHIIKDLNVILELEIGVKGGRQAEKYFN